MPSNPNPLSRWIRIAWALLILAPGPSLLAGPFSDAERITGTERKFRMSRCANSQMAFDSEGRLHVAYWSGGLSTLPVSPSYIYHQTWRHDEGWSAREQIDDSTADGARLGGRHPTLAVDVRDTVWIAWHDHRHSTAAGNWIDNTEVYVDFKPKGGSFTDGELRLTTTSSGHLGDNGYTPKIAAHADGRVAMAWYDFGLDGNVSDLFLKISDAFGSFDPMEPLASMRLTDGADRGGVGSYTVPDLAIDPNGAHHFCWVRGSGSGADLYYAEALQGGTPVQEVLLAAGASDFFDPAHIDAAPNGDVWVVYGDDASGGIGNEDVVLMRRHAGEEDFDPALPIFTGPGRQYAPDLEIDSQGRVHLVWVDQGAETHIRYALLDADTLDSFDEQTLTASSGNWAKPSLAIDQGDQVHVLWEEEVGLNFGAIWFASNSEGPMVVQPASSLENWILYE